MKSFNVPKLRKPREIIAYAAMLVLVACVIPKSDIYAQKSLGSISISSGKRDTSDKRCRSQFCGRVFISPDEIKISPDSVKGDSVVLVLELSNRTDTVITGVWKVYDVVPPQVIALDSTDSEHSSPSTQPSNKKRPGSLLADEGDDPNSPKEGMTLSTWLTGVPDSVTIKPHTTIKMNVVVRVPKDLKEGLYMGWLGAMSEYLGQRPPPQKPIRMGLISTVKITYDTANGSTENNGR